jgi:menaquinone-dependent protoporphyrinogen oxidase
VRFVHDHRGLLAGRPVWLFSVGPLGPKQPEPLKPRDFDENTATAQARSHQVYYGAMDISKLRGSDRLFSRMFKSTQGDFRNGDAIEEWAKHIACELAPVLAG